MERLPLRLVIAVVTFVMGIAAVSARLVYRRPAPTVTVCDLVRNPGAYDAKTIRVRAFLFGSHEMGLYSPECQGRASYIHANFNDESWKTFKAKAKPTGKWHHFMDMNEQEYLVDAVLEGRFQKLKNVDCDERGRHTGGAVFSYDIYCYEFLISDIEHAEAANISWPK